MIGFIAANNPSIEMTIAVILCAIGFTAAFLAMIDKISDKTGWLIVQIVFWGMIAMIFVAAASHFI